MNVFICISCFLALVPSTLSKRIQQQTSKTVSRQQQQLSGSCDVAAVREVCNCNHKSFFSGYQCSSCKDNTKWGYGCDLDCPAECIRGCDFSGNCVPDPNAPPTPVACKRNSRIDHPTDDDIVTNERKECQACTNGHFGLMCDSSCPANCQDSDEGKCTRGGMCYECKDGFFGEDCSQPCPAGCPSCVMLDNLVLDPDSAMDSAIERKGPTGGEFLPAGYCNVQCETDAWGPSCSSPCPTNCKKYAGPSCGKDSGHCKKCQDHFWFGPTCDQACSAGCVGGKCAKSSGECEDGCNAGFWGDACDQQCPEGTIAGCKRNNGEPAKCKQGSYPSLQDGAGTCLQCPATCKNGQCNQDGTCSEGCLLGKFGPRCEQECPATCDGACDAETTSKDDGDCAACQIGYTGSRCHKRCHHTCKECTQHGNAIGPEDCVSCPADAPTILEDGYCNCIEGASRNDQEICACDDPEDADRDAFFELTPRKLCRYICKDGTREVFGDQMSTCMVHKEYKAVIYAEVAGFEQGKCGDGESEIPVQDEDSKCIRDDFIHNIVSV